MKRLLHKTTKDGKRRLRIMVYALMTICLSHWVTALFAIMLLMRILITKSMDDHDHIRWRVTSYNCHDFSDPQIPCIIIATLLRECEFLFVQEHCLADCQLHELNTVCILIYDMAPVGSNMTNSLKGVLVWRLCSFLAS
jgi:hypothetical protein